MIIPAAVLGVGADAWTAIATSVGAAVAVAAGVAAATIGRKQLAEARGQLEEARRVRKAEYQPYVVVFAEDSPRGGRQDVDLVIKNTGRTAAREVTLVFEPQIDSVVLNNSKLLMPNDIPVLVPDQEWRTFWDTALSRTSEEQKAARYVAKVSYLDGDGKDLFGPYEFVLDWSLIMKRGYTTSSDDPVKSLDRAATALQAIAKLLMSR